MRRDSRSRKSTCQPLSYFRCRFGYSVLTTSAAWRITHLTWVHFHSSYWLPSTYPICGYQEEHPLTIIFPSSGLCYIVRLATLFRVLGASGDTDGSLLSRWTALHTTSRRTAHNALENMITLCASPTLLINDLKLLNLNNILISTLKYMSFYSYSKDFLD